MYVGTFFLRIVINYKNKIYFCIIHQYTSLQTNSWKKSYKNFFYTSSDMKKKFSSADVTHKSKKQNIKQKNLQVLIRTYTHTHHICCLYTYVYSANTYTTRGYAKNAFYMLVKKKYRRLVYVKLSIELKRARIEFSASLFLKIMMWKIVNVLLEFSSLFKWWILIFCIIIC